MKFDDVMDAFEFVSSNYETVNMALISLETGEIYYVAECGECDELPDNYEDRFSYAPVPHKNAINLGRDLVFEFAAEYLEDQYDQVVRIFRRRGAYSRFKGLLEDLGKLEVWYEYEDRKKKEGLRKWCIENDIKIDDE
ncbi:MAG: hypothetical protein P9X26_10045 [Candidatus Stygibacter frigidus]|nr:hypothetical protein [Candidatus Stygibacter frigidus]